MIEDLIEKTYPGTRLARGPGDTAVEKRSFCAIHAPLLARLSREGTVALGDVFSPCLALSGVPLTGKPNRTLDILALSMDGGVAAIRCELQGKGCIEKGARSLAETDRRLRKLGSGDDIEALYRKTLGTRHKGETLVAAALASWKGGMRSTLDRLMERWAGVLARGTTALYLALDRTPDEKPGPLTEPLGPMLDLLRDRSGGVFQVQCEPTPLKPAKRTIEVLEAPSRIVWVFRRKLSA